MYEDLHLFQAKPITNFDLTLQLQLRRAQFVYLPPFEKKENACKVLALNLNFKWSEENSITKYKIVWFYECESEIEKNNDKKL